MFYYEDVLKDAQVSVERVEFPNQGITLVGNVYKPRAGELQRERYAAVVVGHPAGGVKEQTAGVYAVKLAERGWLTLTFDAGFQGESGGEPRYLESPAARVEDFRCAVDYLTTRPDVDPERIGILGMCAAGGYVVKAAETDTRIKAIATVSMADLGDMFRTGLERGMKPEELADLRAQIAAQRTREARGGEVVYTGYVANSEEELAGKQNDYWEGYRYYRQSPAKHPRSVNKMIFSRMDAILNFTALDHVELLAPRPFLAIAGTRANTKYFAEESCAKAAGPKRLHWIEGATHIELYYKAPYVTEAVENLHDFYSAYLRPEGEGR